MNSGLTTPPDNVLISIIIATFNAGRYLKDCLASIREQPFKDLEILVIDGGSTDDTIEILKGMNDPRLSWTSGPDAGIYDAMNKGIRMAKGRWCYFLGADDRLLPGFSELAARLKDENAVYYGNSEPYYGDSGETPLLLTGKFSKYRLAKHCMNHQAIIYPTKAFSKYQYELRYKVCADYALNIRLWGDRAFKKIFHPVSIVRYDMTGFSAVNVVNDIPFKKDKLQIIRESMGWLMYARMIYKRFKKKLQGEKDFWEA
jgi:glycosyltransferase involved in cell wall biosynthesis